MKSAHFSRTKASQLPFDASLMALYLTVLNTSLFRSLKMLIELFIFIGLIE